MWPCFRATWNAVKPCEFFSSGSAPDNRVHIMKELICRNKLYIPWLSSHFTSSKSPLVEAMCSSVSLASRGWFLTNSALPSLTSPPAASTASSQIPFFTFAKSPSRAAAKTEDLMVWACWSNSLALSSDDLRTASAWAFLASILFFCLLSASKRSSVEINWTTFQHWKRQTYLALFPSLVWLFGQ